MCSCKRVRWQVFSAGGWAIHLVLCLVEDLAGSPQTGEDVLNCVSEAHCGLIQTWGALYTVAACTACTIHRQVRPSTHACMQTCHSHMHADTPLTHACMQTCHSHMHACRHATHTCMQTRHSHFRVSTKVYVLHFLVTRATKQTRSKYIQFTVHGKQTCQFYA